MQVPSARPGVPKFFAFRYALADRFRLAFTFSIFAVPLGFVLGIFLFVNLWPSTHVPSFQRSANTALTVATFSNDPLSHRHSAASSFLSCVVQRTGASCSPRILGSSAAAAADANALASGK